MSKDRHSRGDQKPVSLPDRQTEAGEGLQRHIARRRDITHRSESPSWPINGLLVRQFDLKDSPEAHRLTGKDYQLFKDLASPTAPEATGSLIVSLQQGLPFPEQTQLIDDQQKLTPHGRKLMQLVEKVYPGAERTLRVDIGEMSQNFNTSYIDAVRETRVNSLVIQTVEFISIAGHAAATQRGETTSERDYHITLTLNLIRANRGLGDARFPAHYNGLETLYKKNFDQAIYNALTQDNITDPTMLQQHGDRLAGAYIRNLMQGAIDNPLQHKIFVNGDHAGDIYHDLEKKEKQHIHPITAHDPTFPELVKGGTLLIWAQTLQGDLLFLPRIDKHSGQRNKHSMLVDGLPVLAAGEAKIDAIARPDGSYTFNLTYINRFTGHYLADEQSMMRALVTFSITQNINVTNDTNIDPYV